jgi:serine protease inhibitor
MTVLHYVAFFALLFVLSGCDRTPKPSAPVSSSGESGGVASRPPHESGAALPRKEPAAPPRADVASLAKASNAFGFDLFQHLRKSPGNLAMSPASVSIALGMTWGGAKGATAKQMKKVLHLEGTPEQVMQAFGALTRSLEDPKRPIQFRIANRLFGEKSYAFEKPYLDATRSAYGAPLEALDFKHAAEASRKAINAWVERQTEQRIQDLIPPSAIDDQTRLVLVNAIYFLGDWAEPFKKEATYPAPFHTSKTATKTVPTMFRTDSFRVADQKAFRVVELPYKGGDLSMLLLVPTELDGIGALEQSLSATLVDDAVRSLTLQRVQLGLPKFRIEPAASLSLGGFLRRMGMTDAFDRNKADFTGIANPPSPADRLFISHVFHKAFVRVDEKGTEAAAATAVLMAPAGAMPERPVVLDVDRPFLFLIRDNQSGLVLFLGRVADPSVA